MEEEKGRGIKVWDEVPGFEFIDKVDILVLAECF